jgi:hypothetical protein
MEPPPSLREWLLDVPLIVGKPLGISVMENTGVLTSVHQIGIIPEMNERSPALAVQPEDRITEVNGVTGDAVQLLKKALARHDKALRLRICRPVHICVSLELDGEDLGLVVEKSTGTITAIRDGSITARCEGPGVQIGDRVVKVNGREPGEDDSIMPWLRLAVAGGVSPLELELIRGSVPPDFLFGNGCRGLESTQARGGTVPRCESESDTETDGPAYGQSPPKDKRARSGSMQSTRSPSSNSDASQATDECAVRPEAGSYRDCASVHPQDDELFPPMFFNKTVSATREGRTCKVAPRFSRLARLRKLGERLILPNCAPFTTAPKNIAADSSSTKRPTKDDIPFLPPLDARPPSRTSSKDSHQLVLPIVSLQSTVHRNH